MLLVAPGPASASTAASNIRPPRRQSTATNFAGLAPATRALAFGFQALASPRARSSVPATVVVCALLQLMVSAPYAANQWAANGSPAIRGLILGSFAYFGVGPMILVVETTLVSGGFRRRYLFSLPITLSIAVCVSVIPVDGSTLGVIPIFLLTLVLSFITCALLLSAAFFATDEHKALHQSVAPLFVCVVLFFGLVTAYVTLAQLFSSPLIGVLLPIGSIAIRNVAVFALVRSCHTFYYEPKQQFLSQLPPSEHGQVPAVVPPLLGDIEAAYGHICATFALIIDNAALVATLVGAMVAPDSAGWGLSLGASALLEVLTRTGVMHRFELRIAAEIAARYAIQWPLRAAHTDAMELLYLNSLGGTGYVAPTMALCIGCLRAVTFGNPQAILWLDVSQTVWRVILAQFAFGVSANVIVWAVAMRGLRQHFELSTRFASGHPLRSTAFRDFDLKGYTFVFGCGGLFIFGVFVAFLGPEFVTGTCQNFAPNATSVWVQRTLECANANATVSP